MNHTLPKIPNGSIERVQNQIASLIHDEEIVAESGEYLSNNFQESKLLLLEEYSNPSVLQQKEDLLTEAIILRQGRPVDIIQNGSFSTSSKTWQDRLSGLEPDLFKSIPSIGVIRITLKDENISMGTGWVCGPRMIATNRHVIEKYAIGSAEFGYSLKRDISSMYSYEATIDFGGECNEGATSNKFKITDVLYIAPKDQPDVAILQVEEENALQSQLPQPLILSSTVAISKSDICIIGFPANNKQHDEVLMKRVFKGVYRCKRAQLGRVKSVHQDYFTHDCSTLGGNSGSPVLDLKSAEVVGIHFGGEFLKNNFAVHSSYIKGIIEAL